MIRVKYDNVIFETDIDTVLPVTIFHKRPQISIYDKDGQYVTMMAMIHVSINMINDILSGDTVRMKSAMATYIKYMKQAIAKTEKIL